MNCQADKCSICDRKKLAVHYATSPSLQGFPPPQHKPPIKDRSKIGLTTILVALLAIQAVALALGWIPE